MKWIKKGLLIEPQQELTWFKSHAMLPTPYYLGGDLFRVFISGRDVKNRSQIGYVDIVVIGDELKVKNYGRKAVLSNGERGCFDDNGVTPSCIVTHKGEDYFYYIGWNSGTSTIRMSLVAGLAKGSAISSDFKRISRAPLLERTNIEPFTILTAPFVLKEDRLWRMWYVSCTKWESRDLPLYNIKYAESSDGVNWNRKGIVAIDFESKNETALARPCVIKIDGSYRMFFSYKDPAIGYRIGYAESSNGIDWRRISNKSGIDVSTSGWDSEMIEYGYVFQHKENYFMLYNGNNYGENGVGYAHTKSLN